MKKIRLTRPRLVFLDAGTLDYGDLDLSPLEKRGILVTYAHTPARQIINRSKNCDLLLVNKCQMTAAVLKKLPGLRAIVVAATGVNNVDLKAAKQLGVAVMNVPDYSTDSVAEMTLGSLLACAKNLPGYNHAAHSGQWSRSRRFCLHHLPNMEIKGKTLGLLGFGAIGKKVAKLARAFQMKILIGKIPGKTYSKTETKRVSFDRLLKQSDFLSIHAPLSPLTRNLISETELNKMKKGAVIINMARGGIVNERALAKALIKGHLAGAALDVLEEEPPSPKNPLFGISNLVLTPHIAWGSLESRQRLVDEMGKNIRAFTRHQKRNRLV